MSEQTITPGPGDASALAEGAADDGEQIDRLERNTLDLRGLITASCANIAPALGLYFSIGVIVANAGLASPFAVLLAAVGLSGTAYTVSAFVREFPAVGSYVSFVTKTFGTRGGIGFGLPLQVGYILLNAGTAIALGSWTQSLLIRWVHVDIPWQIISIAGAGAIYGLMIIGIKTTIHSALLMFGFEVVVLLLLALLVLVNGHGFSSAPITVHSPHGASGIGLAFVLSLYMFLGWEAPVTLSEEAKQPKRTVPRSLKVTLGIAAFIYVLMTYIALVGFHNDPTAVALNAAPFDTLAKLYGNTFVRLLVDIAGFTSIVGSLLGGAASQSRVTFEMGRIGMLPSGLGRTHRRFRTPYVSLLLYYAIAVLIILVWGALTSGSLNVFGQVAGLGTIPVVLMYLVVNLAGVVYTLRGGRLYGHKALGTTVSLSAAIIMCYPLYELIKPGQASPYNIFPWIVLVLTLGSFAYGFGLAKKRPRLADRVDALLAHD